MELFFKTTSSRTGQKEEDQEDIMQEVSVIIPNYNGMAYLEGVLSSLEQQAFQNFETILVDNGSSDGSVAFVMGELSLGTHCGAAR